MTAYCCPRLVSLCPVCLDPFALCPSFSDALDGRDSIEYYGSAAPAKGIGDLSTYPVWEAAAGSGVARTVISPSAVGTVPLSL